MKRALVTGGSRGIGRAVSLKLAEAGYHVIINYKSNVEAANEAIRLVTEAGGSGELLQFDVSDFKDVEAKLDSWHDSNDDAVIEVLVNNAGIRRDNLLLMMSWDEWTDVLDTNLNSFFHITKFVLKGMLAARYGRIINIVSLSGLKGMAGQTNYAAAKAGVIAATKSLALEIGRRKVTVNAVAPGFIETDMTSDLDEGQFKAMIPMRRFGKPEEVADVVAFLASENASYITGEVISVNGGLYM